MPYLSIISLLDGYETIERLVPADNFGATMNRISQHCFNLSKYLYEFLKQLEYLNGKNVIKFYHDTDFESAGHQGGIVNFNVLHADGSYVGFAEVHYFDKLKLLFELMILIRYFAGVLHG